MHRFRFAWDGRKEAENRRKHGVSFRRAQKAFLDPCRVVAPDLDHSEAEPRFFCIGRAGEGILTVRFTVRGEIIRLIGAGYWRKGKRVYEEANQIHR